MRDEIISILFTFFIFVTAGPVAAGDVKSMKDTGNPETTIKVDENGVIFQKSRAPAGQPVRSFKKLNVGLQVTHSFSATNYGAIMGTAILCANFLQTLEETKKLRLTDSLHEVIYSYAFFRDPWRDRFFNSGGTNETDSSNSNLSQPMLRLYQNPKGDKYFEEGKIGSTLKLLQLKREEIFNEIFMGLRLSFGLKNKPMLVEMNISPFPEKGPGLLIAF
jgi:hypothetical protein